jgi:tetratricopeptide (TPR) repeat protein
MPSRTIRIGLFVALFSSILALGWGISTAQEGGSLFATNTPMSDGDTGANTGTDTNNTGGAFATSTPSDTNSGAFATSAPSGILATNTPMSEVVVPAVTSTPTLVPTLEPTPGPSQPLDFYALRMWLEPDLIAMIQGQLETVADDGEEGRRALQLSQYELLARVAGAPTRPADLADLIDTLIASPRGTVDMRAFVRPYILAEINRRGGLLNFQHDGFAVDIQTVRLNTDNLPDALVQIRYPALAQDDANLLLKDTMLVTQTNNGFTQIPQDFNLPPYPFGDVEHYDWVAIGDVNRDGLDEIAVEIGRTSAVDKQLYIMGVRNGIAIDMSVPNDAIRYGEILSWNYDNPEVSEPELVVQELQPITSAPNWVCNAQQAVTWQFDNNFFRRQLVDLNTDFTPQDNLGCTLLEAEPLFNQELRDAIQTVEEAIDAYATDNVNQARANLTLAMLYALNGQLEIASTLGQQVLADYPNDDWAQRQAQALVDNINTSGTTALDICEAMARFSEDSACRINDLLDRYLGLVTLTTDDDLLDQLEFYGFPVSDSVTVSEVGRADRIVLTFAIARTGWWGFRADRDGNYVVERAETPTGFEEASLPRGFIEAPLSAFNALIVDGDPSGALNILATLEQNSDGTPLAYDARYLRALSYDLAGDRQQARRLYYELWQTIPESIWGRLAAEHLELRQ